MTRPRSRWSESEQRYRAEVVAECRHALELMLGGGEHTLRELFRTGDDPPKGPHRKATKQLIAAGCWQPCGPMQRKGRTYRMQNNADARKHAELLLSDDSRIKQMLWPGSFARSYEVTPSAAEREQTDGPPAAAADDAKAVRQERTEPGTPAERIVRQARAALQMLSDGQDHNRKELFGNAGRHFAKWPVWQRAFLDRLLREGVTEVVHHRVGAYCWYHLAGTDLAQRRHAELLASDDALFGLLWHDVTDWKDSLGEGDDAGGEVQQSVLVLDEQGGGQQTERCVAPPPPPELSADQAALLVDRLESLPAILDLLSAWAEAWVRLEAKIDALCEVWDLLEKDDDEGRAG